MTGPTGAIQHGWDSADASTREPTATGGAAAAGRDAVRARQDHRNLTARRWAFGLLVALLAQFGIGIYVNLFTRIPLHHPGHRSGASARSRCGWLSTLAGQATVYRLITTILDPGQRREGGHLAGHADRSQAYGGTGHAPLTSLPTAMGTAS
jgi:hypothetical protein